MTRKKGIEIVFNYLCTFSENSRSESTILPASKRIRNLNVNAVPGPVNESTALPVATSRNFIDYSDDTRSVVSISNHMERLGHDVSEVPRARGDTEAVIPESEPQNSTGTLHPDDQGAGEVNNVSVNNTANNSNTSEDSQGTSLSTNGSSLDARIASLSKMTDAERCTELAQSAQGGPAQHVPMDTDYNYDSEEEVLAGDDSGTPACAESEVPDLEGSDADL